MLDYPPGAPREKPPVVNLLVIILMVGLGFVIVGPLIGAVVALPFFDGGITQLMEALQPPFNDPNLKIPLYIMQGCATIVGLIATPAVYLMSRQRSMKSLFDKPIDSLPALVTIVVVIIFMGVNSIFIEWNANVDFPDFAESFESWAREREDSLGEVTKFLTQFASRNEFLIAIIVIAVLPAIGEEIVFRGLIQNELRRATHNPHVAIWFAAILFSAIHFQFFGFIPRLLLGALFGYLYYWSGNLVIAIIAHFVNNAVSVTALYLYQQGVLEFDVESPEAFPLTAVLTSTVITIALLYYFYRYYQDRKIAIP